MPNILNRKFQYSFWNANMMIVALNVLVFFISNYVYPYLTYMLALMPLRIIAEPSSCYTFVSYMFVHGSIYHLFSNMLGLVIFGTILERRIGSKEYLLFYFLTGTLSGVLSFLFYYLTGSYFVFLLGASGALYAVMLLFAVFFPDAMVFVFGIIPMRAITLVVFYFIIEFASSFASDGISHITHLFGLLAALLYIMIRMRINPFRRRQ
ncbi:MAG TPA: rhomboid family intramembrane serine protease [Candidatus Ornithospirochaeta stercorigallinarum]|nr:rhomboid family intramembrane serine protease [Candidatus Ornithospirochaeta stercorigallinarum]